MSATCWSSPASTSLASAWWCAAIPRWPRSVRAGYQRVRRDAGQVTDNVNEYVRENPGKSILIAAGVGFLIGMLVRGGRRRDD